MTLRAVVLRLQLARNSNCTTRDMFVHDSSNGLHNTLIEKRRIITDFSAKLSQREIAAFARPMMTFRRSDRWMVLSSCCGTPPVRGKSPPLLDGTNCKTSVGFFRTVLRSGLFLPCTSSRSWTLSPPHKVSHDKPPKTCANCQSILLVLVVKVLLLRCFWISLLPHN